MGYLNNSVVTVDAILTTKGRQLLAQNDGSFQICVDKENEVRTGRPFAISGRELSSYLTRNNSESYQYQRQCILY